MDRASRRFGTQHVRGANLDGTCAERFAVRTECTADYECLSGLCVTFDTERICVDAIRLSPSEPLCEELR